MRIKAPHRNGPPERADQEQQLKEFIRAGLENAPTGPEAVLLIARSPESMVSRVLFALSAEVAARMAGAHVIFAGGAPASGDTWRMSFDSRFQHEARLLRDPRFLDGHEQLIIGANHIWYGDSMRRDPDRRDGFASFQAAAPVDVARGRATFAHVWSAAEPIYAHRSSKEPSALPAIPVEDGPRIVPPGADATLDAWRPSTRH